MKLFDPQFINFDGTPVTGRVPPKLRVEEGCELTQQQAGAVKHAYKLFRDALKLSVGDFLVQNRTLQDGTRVRMESMQGQDTVYVWPTGGGAEIKLPHGFVVKTNWRGPKIFRRILHGASVSWKFLGVPVPQAGADITSANQVYRSGGAKYFLLPEVFQRAKKVLWDYARRAGLNMTASTGLPFVLKDWSSGEFNLSLPHYAAEDKILNTAAEVLYTMPTSPQILLPTAPEPDEAKYLAAATDASGNELAMQHMRSAIISPTTGLTKFRYCNEVLRRYGAATYTPTQRNLTEIILPYGAQTNTTGFTDGLLGVDLTGRVFFKALAQSAGSVSGTNGDITWMTGVYSYDMTGASLYEAVVEDAHREVYSPGAATPDERPKIIALPGKDGVVFANLVYALNYPTTINWRMGTKKHYITTMAWMYSPYYYGVNSFEARRIDTAYGIAGVPRVSLELGWKTFNILEGTTTGVFTGHKYVDIKATDSSLSFQYPGGTFPATTYVTAATYDPHMSLSDLYAWLPANNVKPTLTDPIPVQYPPAALGANTTTTTEDVRPANSASYHYISRHLIDYDHKGQFYAALRIEVTAAGATWVEDRSYYDGHMIPGVNPTYTVSIYFESQWGLDPVGAESALLSTASVLLSTESVSRPAFEFASLEKLNPYYWGLPAYIDRSTFVRMPPSLTPAPDALEQFKALTNHQGFNDRLACEDVRSDLPGSTRSAHGVEFSTESGGRIVPPEKYVTGQLYARTFSIGQFNEALWMLTSLAIDAPLDNFVPDWDPERPGWYYFPATKAALSVMRHIEVRDGVIENWSDELPGETSGFPPTAAPPPEPLARDIKLYRV